MNGYWVMVNEGFSDEPDRLVVITSRWSEFDMERWGQGFLQSAPLAGPFKSMDDACAFQHAIGHLIYS